ncbi:MAG: alpha/beta hydrolase [Crocinitomicaceae bacterium]|jgi:pimeloyl-ACP methyl ester carboxylesterase|nr:alpha/beta hydrolase [Crocinitomicaceae bacterium]MDP4724592.1 alpha/beta hydrolase [Crocinitomicaceae bacterium]MDP4739025.1 alpha/beta hydrolase [Crocinitomicaceae bacterium]MDP4799194.1 alpha/beta hydrolase [Crocinitomicaceae bacterium]MDP4807045.1 alpha/beta hydrolase [Crocinitomicaceae bacterium]
MKNIVIILLVGLTALACRKRLDGFLFNPSQIESYQLDAYQGELTLDLAGEFGVPDSMIHHLEWNVELEEGTAKMSAIYVGDLATIASDTVILYCHGNKDHMDFYWPRQKLYAHAGGLGRYGVLMFDYPSFGLSEGKSSEANMYRTTARAIDWLQTQGLQNERFVIFGFSLGSAAACEVAAHPADYALSPSKLILEAPFASAEVMIQDAGLLSMPGSFLVDLQIDNATEIKKINIPLLWIHGEDDSFLTVKSHGQPVYDNKTTGYKEAYLVPGGEHETTPFVSGYQNYIDHISTFIQL